MWNSPHKLILKIVLSFTVAFLLYLSFSKYEIWFLSFLAFFILFAIRDSIFWFLSGFFFFFMALRCSGIAGIEFGGLNPFVFYIIFLLFAVFLGFYQFYIPIKIWSSLFRRIIWALPLLYVALELVRSHFPYGGFPWLIMGSLSVYIPVLRESLMFFNVYFHSLFILFTSLFIFQKRFKSLILMWAFFALVGLIAMKEKAKKIEEAKSIEVALVQTAIHQEDKLNIEAFSKHTEDILNLVEKATSLGVDLVVLPESAFPFFYSEDSEGNIRLSSLSLKVPILLGFIDIRKGMNPYNSAYLLKDGISVDYYDKVKLFPIGEYVPKPFDFLKKLFPAIGGIDYVPGDRIKPVEYKDMKIATPICFEVAYYHLVKKLSTQANLIVVLTNDGWFKDSDCTHQHYLWARVRALENGKYVLWVNNSGDTGVINPYGKTLQRMPYMKRGIISHEVKLLQ